MKNPIVFFVRQERGQDLIEYTLLAALLAVASIGAFGLLAGGIDNVFTAITAALNAT